MITQNSLVVGSCILTLVIGMCIIYDCKRRSCSDYKHKVEESE